VVVDELSSSPELHAVSAAATTRAASRARTGDVAQPLRSFWATSAVTQLGETAEMNLAFDASGHCVVA